MKEKKSAHFVNDGRTGKRERTRSVVSAFNRQSRSRRAVVHPPPVHPPLANPSFERTPRAFGVLVIPGAAGIGPPGLPAVPFSLPCLPARPSRKAESISAYPVEGGRTAPGRSADPMDFLSSPRARGHWSRKLGSRSEVATARRTIEPPESIARTRLSGCIDNVRWALGVSTSTRLRADIEHVEIKSKGVIKERCFSFRCVGNFRAYSN